MARCCPILHLNGYKIAGPTVLGRSSDDGRCGSCSRATATTCDFVEGDEPGAGAPALAADARRLLRRDPRDPERRARERGVHGRPRWPVIVLRTPKGWTGPKVVDGIPVEGTFRAHQVPLARRPAESRASRDARSVDAQLSAGASCSTRRVDSCRSWRRWPRWATGAWAPTRTPTAARSSVELDLPDLPRLRARGEAAGDASATSPRVRSASSCATSSRRTPGRRTSGSSARTR